MSKSPQSLFIDLFHASKSIVVFSPLSKLLNILRKQMFESEWTCLPIARFCRYNAQRLLRETGRCSTGERALQTARLGSLRLLVGSASANSLANSQKIEHVPSLPKIDDCIDIWLPAAFATFFVTLRCEDLTMLSKAWAMLSPCLKVPY